MGLLTDNPQPAEASAKTPDAPEVLAVVTDADSLETLKEIAAQEKAVSMRVVRGGIRDTAKILKKLPQSPRLLIVDISGVDLPLTEVDALADACEPSVQVVVVGDNADMGLFRELMRLGVSDYLVKPLFADLIVPHLLATNGARVQGSRTGKVVALCGTRGGVGATTVAASMASILSSVHHRRVLLIDLDPYGGALRVQLGVEAGGLMEALDNVDELDSLFLERTLAVHGPRLYVLADDQDITTDPRIDLAALEKLLQALEQQFHYIIVDVPGHQGRVAATVLQRAAMRILVSDRTVASARELTRLLTAIDGTGGRTMLLLNDTRPGGEGLAKQQMIEESIDRPFNLAIPFDKGLARAADNLGVPAAEGRGGFADSMRTLSGLLIGKPAKKTGRRWLRWGRDG